MRHLSNVLVWLAAAALAAALIAQTGAQLPGLTTVGPITPGNCASFASPTQIQDAGGACSRQLVIGNISGTLNQGSTNYCNTNSCNNNANNQTAMTVALGTHMKNLELYSGSAPAAGQTYIATLYMNGLTMLSCSITNPSTSCSDTMDVVAVPANTKVYVRIDLSATAGANSFAWSLELDIP